MLGRLKDHGLIVASYIADVVADPETTDKALGFRLDALIKLMSQLRQYKERGFLEELLCAIAEKKGKLILAATTKREMEQILFPRVPHFDGNRFIPDKYSIPEEELIAWSETSMKDPLIAAASDRYRELFSIVFPEQAKEFFQEGA